MKQSPGLTHGSVLPSMRSRDIGLIQTLTLEARVAGYEALLNEDRELMGKESAKAAKSEKKLGVMLATTRLGTMLSRNGSPML